MDTTPATVSANKIAVAANRLRHTGQGRRHTVSTPLTLLDADAATLVADDADFHELLMHAENLARDYDTAVRQSDFDGATELAEPAFAAFWALVDQLNGITDATPT